MFKPRSAAASATPPSVELVRQRAKHRLVGVSLLVLAGVVLFPLLFDTQPRAIPVDIPIEIPSRKTAKPLTVDPVPDVPVEQVVASAPKGAEVKQQSKSEPSVKAVVDDEEVILSHTPARSVATPQAPMVATVAKPPVSKQEPSKVEPVPVKEAVKELPKEPAKPVPVKEVHKEPAKEAPKPAPVKESAKEPVKDAQKDAAADAARAMALLEGKAPPVASKPAVATDAAAAAAVGARYIVQVGAFADSTVAQSARLKLERAGLKTYTHEAQTPEGKRIRVRLGPFATKAEAEKAAAKAKATGTAAAILTL